MINDLVYKRIEFPLSKKDSRKIDVKNKFVSMFIYYENKFTYPIYV